MDSREIEALVGRLVQNPQDHEALTLAHQAGQTDPKIYAGILERVGNASTEPALSAYWLTEAANVWIAALNDAPRAARALMVAIERDPTQQVAADKLADLYRERGDTKALVALLEKRAKALTALASRDPALRPLLAQIHEELGRLWSEPPLSQMKKAADNYRKAVDCDPSSQYAIYALREMLKAESAWSEAIPYFELEQRIVDDPERKIALYQDEANVRRSAGDLAGATVVLRKARAQEGGTDPGLKQFLATLALERVQSGQEIADADREEGSQLFVELAEEYPGEHGLAYCICALEVSPGHERAAQLALYYGEQLNREVEVAQQAAAFLRANPSSALAPQARDFIKKLAEQGLIEDSLVDALGPTADAPVTERVLALLDQAGALSRKARKPEAAEKYQQVLELDRANEEAVAFMEGYLRQRRKYPELRELLFNAGSVADAPSDLRRSWLRELAGLCETQLRDVDGAIAAWQSLSAIDPEEENHKEQLRRLFERAGRWDDLVVLLEQEAEQETDVERRVGMERTIAKIHDQKRHDLVATGQTWARIAALLPDDESAILSAVKYFEKAGRLDLAVQVIADNVATVTDERTRGQLFQKLGEMREAQRDFVGAGEAYAESGQLVPHPNTWAAAERCFVQAEAWNQAATAGDERAQMLATPKEQAELYAIVAFYLVRAGDDASALLKLEQATQLDPNNDEYAEQLEKTHEAAGRHEERVFFLLKRADLLSDPARRKALRRKASEIQRDVLNDTDAARQSLKLVLTDGDDVEALTLLADDAERQGEAKDAVEYLGRLARLLPEPAFKIGVMMRQAQLLAENLDEPASAIDLYESILSDLQPNRPDLLATIANLHERLDNPKGTAKALERRLALLSDGPEKLEVARALADLYEIKLDDRTSALARLDIVRSLDPEDYDALRRCSALAEATEDWARYVRHLSELISIEGDDNELSAMTRRLAQVLHDKLGKSADALAALLQVADIGDDACREEYVKLADSLGDKAAVAAKLVEWHSDAPAGEERNSALRGAFERFVSAGLDKEAVSVARELVHSRAADAELAHDLERIAVRIKDIESLQVAHDLMLNDLSGVERAEEAVRQTEVLVNAGVEIEEAVSHGEQSLTGVEPSDVEPLLQKLTSYTQDQNLKMGLYERQVTRCKAPIDRLKALGRAAQVAAEFSQFERARAFFDIALGGAVQPETLELLESVAVETDAKLGGEQLRRVLAESMAAGGQGSRDAGRTRGMLLRRAAGLAARELKDLEQAFTWLSDAVIAHVDDESLDDLQALAIESKDLSRMDAALTRALEEVFDGPLVRKILGRRAQLKMEQLGDKTGAAADLKRIHDLAPSDASVIEHLAAIYEEIGDYKGMVQLLEDQILRGKDPAARADLARKVAQLWEEKLGDAREAADAWRRVLRMKAGDREATEGLERAKSNMLKRPSGDSAGFPAALPLSPEVAHESSTKEPPKVDEEVPDAHENSDADQAPVATGGLAADASESAPESNAAEDEVSAVLTPVMDESGLDESLPTTTGDDEPSSVRPATADASEPGPAPTKAADEALAELAEDGLIEEPSPSTVEALLEPLPPSEPVATVEPLPEPVIPAARSVDTTAPSATSEAKTEESSAELPAEPPGTQPSTVSTSVPPARRPPPPPPARSSARPPLPPIPGRAGARPPLPPSMRPNPPPPPPPQRAAAQPEDIEMEEIDEEGITVEENELLD